MARPRKFPETEVLDRATRHFWAHGYRGSSSGQVATACGLHEPSLYHQFGNKAELYRRCLRHYQQLGATAHAQAAQHTSPLARIRALLTAMAGVITAPENPGGCLVTHSLAELHTMEGTLAEEVRAACDTTRATLRQWLTEAVAAGELPPDFDPAQGTDFLSAQIYGWGLLVRLGREHVAGSVEMCLKWLDGF